MHFVSLLIDVLEEEEEEDETEKFNYDITLVKHWTFAVHFNL